MRGATFAAENPRGCVVLASGRSEFIEKYFEVISDLQARGFSAAMMDWRGQGLSERLLPDPQKGHISDFGAFRADLVRFTQTVVAERFDGPYFLMTHSMGGAPALQLLGDGYDRFTGAVLAAPMTRLFANAAKRRAVGAIAYAACRAGFERRSIPGVKEESLRFEGNVLTADRERHERFRELQATAPRALIREPTYGWLRAAHDAMADLHKPGRFKNLKTPVLILSAENDRLINSSDHAFFGEAHPLIEVVTIKDALHEIMMEKDAVRDRFWAAADAFFEKLLAG